VGANDALLNGQTKEQVLNVDWKTKLRAKTTYAEIDAEWNCLKELIDCFKEIEEGQKTAQQNMARTSKKKDKAKKVCFKEEAELSKNLRKLLKGERTKKSAHMHDPTGLSGNIEGDIKK